VVCSRAGRPRRWGRSSRRTPDCPRSCALIALNQDGLAESSVRRFRASLSAFFAWAVRERLILSNPVTGTRVPKGRGARTEIRPLAEDELESFHMAVSARDPRLADVLLIPAWTGLGLSELREARLRDFVRVPMPVLLVSRAAPEGVEAKVTKSGRILRGPGRFATFERSGGARRDTTAERQRKNPAAPAVSVQVGRRVRVVELRGFEPLTFSLREGRLHRPPNLGRARRNGSDLGRHAASVSSSTQPSRSARTILESLGSIARSKRGQRPETSRGVG
jgi:hypothetical protein